MARWTLGFLVGVIIITYFSYLPPLQIAGWCIAVSGIGFIFFRPFSSLLFTFFTACFLGFSWALLTAHYRIYHTLPRVLEGQILIATGVVTSMPMYYPHQLRFDFLIKELTSKTAIHYPLRVRLSSYRYRSSTRLSIKKGDVWQFAIRLKRPRAFWSEGSFDYEAALFQQNIQATGYIINRIPAHLIKASSVYYFIDHLRESLTHNIQKTLKNYPLKGLISALSTGVRYEITDAQWQVMRKTGTNHLFAISGLHLTFIVGIIYFLTRFFWCRIPNAALVFPASQVAALLTGLFAIVYAVLSGFALPIQRALFMLLVFLWVSLLRRNLSLGYTFHCALLIILVYAPFSILSASFWLSFTAVAFILYSALGRLKAKGWRTWGRTQWSVGCGLIPISLLFFHQISWISFVANIIAIPLIGFIILPLALLGNFTMLLLPSRGAIVLVLTERLLELLWQLLSYLSTLQWAQYTTFITTPWILVSSMLGLLLLLAPQGFPARFLSVIYLLPLFFWKSDGPKNGEVWFSLLDVGQGLATVIRTQHHTLIYDTGPNRTFDAGSVVLLPYLQKMGIQKLDMLMVSHGDNDHIGGAYSLLEQMPVAHIVSSIPKKFLPRQAEFCHKKTWQWDKVNFEVMYPTSNTIYLGNDSSCVLKVSSGQYSILLVGDIEAMAENYLINHMSDRLASTILVVPHHGSKTSSSITFLNKVQPSFALFSTGYRNQFKFPHSIVLKRYQRLHSILYDTAVDGTIAIKLNPNFNNIQVETYRQRFHRFWQG